MPRTMSSVTTTGARPPATSTAPITRSASARLRSIAPRFDASVMIRPRWIWSTHRSRSRFLSTSTTSASMPAAIHAAFQPTLPAPSTTTLRRAHAGRAAHQHAAPPVVALEEVGAHLRGEPAGHLAHRRQQRQRPVVELDGLVGERGRLRRDQRRGDLRVGGEVEVGEQREVGAQERRTRRPGAPSP